MNQPTGEYPGCVRGRRCPVRWKKEGKRETETNRSTLCSKAETMSGAEEAAGEAGFVGGEEAVSETVVGFEESDGSRFLPAVNVTNVEVVNNPCSFLAPFQFEITFEVLRPMDADVEWCITYVGSAASEEFDQHLDTVETPMQHPGVFKFIFQADAPDCSRIPAADLIGVTVVLLTCKFQAQEFLRIGYYVACEYEDEELKLNPPETHVPEKLTRNILSDKPRVTRFLIDWNTAKPAEGTADSQSTQACA